jgi:DNA-binding CsgD family transcriptional regulator
MSKGYHRTGYFFALIFLLGALISGIDAAINQHKSWMAAFTHPLVLICVFTALLMVLSANIGKLAWLQPLMWLGSYVLSVCTESLGYASLGFFIIAVLLLFRFGFYEKQRTLKMTVSLGLFYSTEILSAIFIKKRSAFSNLASIFIFTCLLVTLYLAFQEKLLVYLREPKNKLSLAEKGLSEMERLYVLKLVKGKSPKEIAFLHEVSESTVRNTLAHAYRKLDVNDRASLAALAERVELVP